MELSGQLRVPAAYAPTGNILGGNLKAIRRCTCATQLELRLARAGGVEHRPHPDANLAPLDARCSGCTDNLSAALTRPILLINSFIRNDEGTVIEPTGIQEVPGLSHAQANFTHGLGAAPSVQQ
jgi:hypothetical protein